MSTPLVRLSGLDLLRGFVAAGRHMSMTLAARELCITQSAISRQIRMLEEQLGVKLFFRGYRSIDFTPEGERLFATANSSIQQLQDVVGDLTASRWRLPVTITASIGVTALWLLPRLASLQRRFPDIEVRVAASNRNLNLRTEGVDLAIRYARASAVPQEAVRLFGEVVVPVAHPSLDVGPPAAPNGIGAHVLLEFDDPARPWLQWGARLAALGCPAPRPRGVLRFNQYDSVIQAALAGQGIALGRLALVAPLIDEGRLARVDVTPETVETEHAYWLLLGSGDPRSDVRTVIEWIMEEAEACSKVALGASFARTVRYE